MRLRTFMSALSFAVVFTSILSACYVPIALYNHTAEITAIGEIQRAFITLVGIVTNLFVSAYVSCIVYFKEN